MRYELYYGNTNQGRGEFVRLAFEEARADYVDVARESGPGLGPDAMVPYLKGTDVAHPQFAPPFLKHGDLVIGQTANILHYLAPRLGLAPDEEGERLWTHQLQLTIADLVMEIQHTHHPVAHGLYYEDQKAEALTYTGHFLAERLPKFLGFFKRVLGGREHLVGNKLRTPIFRCFSSSKVCASLFPGRWGGSRAIIALSSLCTIRSPAGQTSLRT